MVSDYDKTKYNGNVIVTNPFCQTCVWESPLAAGLHVHGCSHEHPDFAELTFSQGSESSTDFSQIRRCGEAPCDRRYTTFVVSRLS